ncbi:MULTISPECIES: hypothetical protein [unclassified Streptomyces]|uniref:hypothetical protein n=1 Tax=unclassified Streptomyces TaxID=2593676 RepID=UPI0023660991|nr:MULTISPECIES: hypothetical protein [unclassified Streptomyces]MDF3147566.1 hypothetical protein [Streptomyces sp. T21Q-yed]WDF35661.1 hypothetical protein PBV52_01980 [Streptomyces sp. T12]
MTDDEGRRHPWWRALRESVQGADTELRPEGLRDVVPAGFDGTYVQFGDLYPEQQLQLQLLHGASQRAFERRTRISARVTVVRVLGNALSDPRLADAKPNEHLTQYLDQEIADLRGRLAQDSATAVSRGLNIGLAVGSAASLALLAVPLLWGVDLLGALGVTLNCANRWSLLGAFVCGGVGAFGAVLSVLVRLRGSVDQLTRRLSDGREDIVVPGQMARSMRHEGVYRVFVGWILALAVYFLLSGGIVPVFESPATAAEICPAAGSPGSAAQGTEFWGFWSAIGFVAGFNERWAFGILSRDSTRRSGKSA